MTRSIDTTALIHRVYDSVFERAHLPAASELAAAFGVDRDTIIESIRNANLGKTLVPDPHTGEIWMAGPFAARPTTHRVTAGARTWWANCAWDAFGIAALVDEPVEIHTECADCAEPVRLRVDAATQSVGDSVVHFLVPARDWYDDIGFT